MRVRLLSCGVLSVFLAVGGASLSRSQDPAPAVQPQDQFFAGIVTALSDASVTVTRTVLGKESTIRTFAITPETHIEGKPKLKSRVTVRFVAAAAEEGATPTCRAVRIIVRGGGAGPKKP